MTELHDHSALELGGLIAAGQTSAVECAQHFLGRIHAEANGLGAFVTVTAEGALREAEAADRRRADAEPGELGPLHGVPFALKDLVDTAGVRTTYGSAAFADHVPVRDDELVTLLRTAGLVSLGKTHTPEFGATCYTESAVAPPARTPWKPELSAAGSSGGAAAAVSAGLLPVAQGSDTGGSIRSPASVCGLVGLKPTRGRVTYGPTGTDNGGLSTRGPLTRTVRDAAALLDAMTGGQSGYLSELGRSLSGLTIGVLVDAVNGTAVDEECMEAVAVTAKSLAEAGHAIVNLPAPRADGLEDAFWTVSFARAAMTPVPDDRELLLQPFTQELRRRGHSSTGPAILRALAELDVIGRSLLGQWSHVDVVLSPTLAQLPRAIGELRHDGHADAEIAAMGAFAPFTPLANVTGQPSLALPVHWTSAGIPVGVQITGPLGSEPMLLALGLQLEEKHEWPRRRPPGW